MPPKQMNTRMIKEALRYKFELDHSFERTAMALKISKGVVAKYVGLSKASGLDWSQIEAMTEAQLQARLLPGPQVDGADGHYLQPDYAAIHLELKRKGMTLMLLWQRSAVPAIAMCATRTLTASSGRCHQRLWSLCFSTTGARSFPRILPGFVSD